jgi:recombination protein RecT
MSTEALAVGTKQLPALAPGQIVDIARLEMYTAALTEKLGRALPVAMRPDASRFARALVSECRRNEGLAKCTALSLLGAAVKSAELGLEIGGMLGQGYLVPYWSNKVRANEAQLQIGYRGYCVLAHRSGQVKTLSAQVAYANDQLDIRLGTDPRVLHIPAAGARGDWVGVYAYLVTAEGGVDVEWMARDQIEAHRDRYSKGYQSSKAGKAPPSPWETAPMEMARKTPLRLLAKRSPVSVALMEAATLDDAAEDFRSQDLRVVAAEALGQELPDPRSRAAAAIADGLEPRAEDA